MSEIITENNFAEKVENSNGLVLVDFFAVWCGPCRMLGPVLDEIAQEKQGALQVYKVDTDDSRSLAMRFAIQAVPTMILFKDGRPVKQLVGALPKAQLLQMIAEFE